MSGRQRRLDGCVAKVYRAAVARHRQRGFVVYVGAADNNLKLGSVLSDISGFAGGYHGAKEGAFDAGDRGWSLGS